MYSGNSSALPMSWNRLSIRRVLVALVGLLLVWAHPAISLAQPYPTKPIRIVVPFTPGGGSDSVARIVGLKLGELLGQSVVVENKPGAGGLLATTFVANSPADGYTLLMADTSFAANLSVYAKPGYALKDFAAVGRIGSVPFVVIVGPHVHAKSIADLVSLAKRKPGELNMASGGAGGVSHLQAARFAMATGITWAHVPYRGVSPAILDVAGGQADVSFPTVSAALPFMKSGKVKALAVTSRERSSFTTETPTLAELGYPNLTADNWYGLVAPAKTDPVVLAKLHGQLEAALRSPEVRAQLLAQSVVAAPQSLSKDFATLLKTEADTWAKTVKAAGISAN